ncbi:hypothetical protein D1BOALGB6SA_9478 [Olavius sp. associated proteobacterium Delta 1]|nr:hypothetical protein D1BOALGB6SA_9478 [Olavius sp. associated proteobacterium Delta 1]
MLNHEERKWVYRHAYLPEHLPDYVGAVSGAEPFLHRNYLYFLGRKHLIFNGYPLVPGSDPPARIYDFVCERFQPTTVAVIASPIWLPAEQYEHQTVDSYYRLDLPLTSIDAAVAYMLRRAQRDLQVSRGCFGKEHKKIIKAFLADHSFNRRQKYLFKHIPQYLKASDSALLFEARTEKELVAFNIVDLGAADYACYLFSFRSSKINVPGASDLLLHEMIKLAHSAGKKAVNLGLGVNAGIRHFKEKWGGVPFLNYSSVLVDKREVDIGKLARKL